MAKRKQEEVVYKEAVVETPAESPIQSFLTSPTFAYIIGGLALLAAGWFAYKQFVVKPQQVEAENLVWKAQQYFDRDSFQLALASPMGDYKGFEEVANDYGSTKSGNMARYYAGVCNLQLGNFDKAIEYLEDFSPADNQFAIMKSSALGDCYSEKNELDKALSAYSTAAGAGDNELLTPYVLKKAGMLCEYQNKAAEAAKFYQKIKSKYPSSPVSSDIDKYLARVGIVD